MNLRPSSIWLMPALVLVAIAGFVAWSLLRGDAPVDRVAIEAAGPRFETLGELTAAAEVIVVGEVVATDDGRSITDPRDPTVGVRTQLVRLETTDTLRGDPPTAVIVEQESTLLDGTPIVVNDLPPASVGERGIWFLVGGDGSEFPYFALVNEQAFVADGVAHPDWGRPTIDDVRATVAAVVAAPDAAPDAG